MLKNLTLLKGQPIEKLHQYIKHIIVDVCCADNNSPKPFSIELFGEETQKLLKKSETICKRVQAIYSICQTPQFATGRAQLIEIFKSNELIEQICTDTAAIVYTYEDIKQYSPDLATILHEWGKELYENSLNLKFLTQNAKSYYDKLLEENGNLSHCIYCGIGCLLDKNTTYRDAFDHILDKASYPFTSVNLNNLVPMCWHCNSSYKGSRDIIIDDVTKQRRAIYYPFGKECANVHLEIQFSNKCIGLTRPLDKSSFTLYITEQKSINDKKTNIWKKIFGIEERYTSVICNSAQKWYTELWVMNNRANTNNINLLDLSPSKSNNQINDIRTTCQLLIQVNNGNIYTGMVDRLKAAYYEGLLDSEQI